jgi:hypothetical protein
MRFKFAACAMLALALVTARCDRLDGLVRPDDELLATASYVFDATAERQLAERDWLFRGKPIFNWIGTAGRSPYFVGWWNIKPEGAERWAAAFPLRPAPRNSTSLVEGKRFLVVADADFHLLLVYPVEPNSDQYLPGMSEREFRDHVFSLRMLYSTVSDFLAAVTDADWDMARYALCASLWRSKEASGNPDTYLAKLGVPRFQRAALPTFQIVSMTEKKARVMVQGADGRRARLHSGVRVKLALTLTKTRRSMGPLEWEIVQIEKIEEQPWNSQPQPAEASTPASRPQNTKL